MGNFIHLSEKELDEWGYKPTPSNVDDIRKAMHLPSKSLRSIEPGVFSRYNQLTFLNLSNNFIVNIYPHTFRGLNILKLIS